MAATAEIPVPPSAFAPLKRSGDSGKSSADISPFSSTVMTGKDTDDEDAAANSDEGADFQVSPDIYTSDFWQQTFYIVLTS